MRRGADGGLKVCHGTAEIPNLSPGFRPANQSASERPEH